MMKILVTGANGYLGQGVVKTLLDKGGYVIASDFQDDYIDKRANVKKCDLFSLEEPYEYFEEPDILLHLAWRDGFKHNSLAHVNDFPKHYQFIKKMLDGGLKQFCGMGSMHEVGFFEGCIDENTQTNPMSLYGISKNALRQACQLMTEEKNVIFQWIRGFYIVGNSDRGCSIFSKIELAERQKQELFPFTTGTNQYDFIDYEEFCEQVVAVVMQNQIRGIINCCSGRPMKLSERVEQFIQEHDFKIKLEYGAFKDRAYDSKAVWGNDEKIKCIMMNR